MSLRELEKAATPGPWWADVPGFGTIFRGTSYEDSRDDGDWLYDPRGATEADSALIAALRNAAPFLLDVVDQMRAVHREGKPSWPMMRDDERTSADGYIHRCKGCGKLWPCPEGVALASLDEHLGGKAE